jgi:hypothetical protein
MKRPSAKAVATAYETIAQSAAGKIVLADLLFAAGVWRDGYIADQNFANFRKGERNIGLRIMAQLQRSSPRALFAVLGDCYEAPKSQEKPEENDNG